MIASIAILAIIGVAAVPADYHPDSADSGADHRPDDLQPQEIEEKRDS